MNSLQKYWKNQWQNRGNPSWKWVQFYPFAIGRAYLKERIPEDAQSLVYVTLLTLVPLLAVAFSLLHGFGVQGVIEPWLRELFHPMGASGNEVVDYLLQFVNQTSANNLGIIGIVFLFWSVINIAQRIENTLNVIWRVDDTRSFKARISGYLTAVLLAPLLIAALMSMMLGMKSAAWLQPFLKFPSIETIFNLLTSMLPTVIVFVMIACVYAWIPNRHVQWRAAFAGASVFLLLWYPVSWMFSVFIAGSKNYSVIYSSFATVIILLFWLYFLWMIFLIGAKTASLIQMPLLLAPDNDEYWHADEQLKLGIAILLVIEQHFKKGEDVPDLNTLTAQIPLSPQKIRFILKRLLDAKLIIATRHEPPRYLPSVASEHYYLKDIYIALAAPIDHFSLLHPKFDAMNQQRLQHLDIALDEWLDILK